ncbi:MAG: EamA family transporter [Gemmataceae bacterium]|nr:EamA family transporter [Gemmataceae bacterium]
MDARTAAKSPPPTWAVALAFAIIYVVWGTTYMAIKLGVRNEQLPPLLFGGARFLCGGVLVLGYQWLRGASQRLSLRDALLLVSTGLLLFAAGNGFITYAQKTVESSVAAVLIATTPLWIGLWATLWPHGERLTPRGWLGLFVGLGGVALLLAPMIDLESTIDYGGFLLVLGSAASWALASVILRHVHVAAPHLTAAGYQMLLGGASMLILGALGGEAGRLPDRVTAGAVLVFLYLLVFASLCGFIAFNWLLGHVSAAKVSTYAYVNPLVAVLIGWTIGGEELTWGLWAGMGTILFSVFLVRGAGVRSQKSEGRSQK